MAGAKAFSSCSISANIILRRWRFTAIGGTLNRRTDSSRCARVAAKLVTQATEAFAHGHEEEGRRLVTKAARIYEQNGEPEVAVELLVERGLTDSAVVIAARNGQHDRAAELLGTLAPWTSSSATPTVLPGPVPSIPSPVPSSPPLSQRPPPEAEAQDSPSNKPPFDPPDDVVLHSLDAMGRVPTEARFREAYRVLRGRSPLTQDLSEWVRELKVAEAFGASAYALHLRTVVQRFDPHHPALQQVVNHEPDEADFPVGVPHRAEEEHLAQRFIASEERMVPGGNVGEPAAMNSSTTEIDAAISALVKVSGGDSDISTPLDLGPVLKLTPPVVSTEDLSGTMLRGRFRLEEKVGRGAQAQVYRARDQVLNRELAIKVLSDRHVDNPDALEGFLVEARLAAQVHHPGCLEVFDFGRERELTFLAMEYFESRSLRNLLRAGRLELLLTLHVGNRLAEALEAIHAAGIVHRDVKPSNILVNRKARPKLTDFGVAVHREADHEEGMMVGTIRYMAPEQARGRQPHPTADIFSLGAVLWEMLAGKPPFEPTVEGLKQRLMLPPPPLPTVKNLPAEVVDIVMQCLSLSASSRPSSAAQVAHVLGRSLGRLRRQRLLASTTDVGSPPNKSSD